MLVPSQGFVDIVRKMLFLLTEALVVNLRHISILVLSWKALISFYWRIPSKMQPVVVSWSSSGRRSFNGGLLGWWIVWIILSPKSPTRRWKYRGYFVTPLFRWRIPRGRWSLFTVDALTELLFDALATVSMFLDRAGYLVSKSQFLELYIDLYFNCLVHSLEGFHWFTSQLSLICGEE